MAKSVAICMVLAVVLLAGGCGFRTLQKNIEQIAEQAVLEGYARVRGAEGNPIVIVVYNITTVQIVDLFVLPRSGPFFFALPAGKYQLAAFEDRNRDLLYKPGEDPAVLVTDLELRAGERRTGLDLAIDPGSTARIPFAVKAFSPERREINQFPALQLGTITNIDDPRFSDEDGKLGLWDPLRFLFDVGAGVYFLEEYDPHKIPVLFVHGAVGHPGDWKYLVSSLDRSRFQPWLVYYPTAPHLDRLGRGLVRAIGALKVKYGFSELILVAHSMGGLVTRAALNYTIENVGTERATRVPAFVSISTPWNGHSGAAKGVEYSPVVAPSWEDMAPGSSFLTRLSQTPLPPECEYSLFFSYRDGGIFSGEANDGTVTVSSELAMPIQRQAFRVMGFDENHTSILESREVAAQLNAILDRARIAKH
ncbi:MAG TPA: alpha/beta fold hydrolase [Thermodesulfobacteriota bacterium]|nr:alpha/beta fold hydrolase [Thermodesulfobacteriota bacterium]